MSPIIFMGIFPSIDSVLSELNENHFRFNASVLKYLNDFEIDLDFVETLVERTKDGFIRISLFPDESSSFFFKTMGWQ